MIKHKSKLDEDLKNILLEGLPTGPNYFNYEKPQTHLDHAVLILLQRLDFKFTRKYVEYWFQHQTAGQDLWPHVDYNKTIGVESPITLACYLEVNDLVGGELCISEKTWLTINKDLNSLKALKEELLKCNHECYSPVENDVLYFEGSKYYHWINPVVSGSRKSMLINFWDEI